MILGTFQEVEHLDPSGGGLANNDNARIGLYSKLWEWAYDGSGVPEGQLVQSWEFTPDGRTLTFTIPDNVFFHDGRKMTADDVKYTFDRAYNPETQAPWITYAPEIESTDVVDDTTVRFNLTAPNGALLSGLTFTYIMDEKLMESGDFQKNGNGTGPFKFVEFVVHDRVVMDRHENYWEEGTDGKNLPYIDGVTIKTLPDSTALFTALITGLVDLFWQMTPKFTLQLRDLPNAPAVAEDAGLKTSYSQFWGEGNRGIFADARARKAVALTIDREASNFAGYAGLAETNPTNSIFPPGGPFTNPDIPEISRDVAAAKALWQEVFAEHGEGPVTFIYTAISPEFKPMALVHMDNFKEVGVDFEVQFLALQVFFDVLGLFGQHPTWKVDDSMAAVISFRDTEPAKTLTGFVCNKHWSYKFCEPELDEWITKGKESTDFLQRQEAYYKLQEVYQPLYPAFTCCWRAQGHGRNERVQNFRNHFGWFYYTRVWLKQ